MAKSPAQRAYLRRVGLLMAPYAVLVFAASYARREDLLGPGGLAIVASAAGLCIAGVFWALGRLIVEEEDEFLRMLTVCQSLIATGFALSLCSVYGFLTAYGLAPAADLYWAAVLWFLGLGVGAIANRIRFGTTGQCA